jgi:uncharacterized protein YoxC
MTLAAILLALSLLVVILVLWYLSTKIRRIIQSLDARIDLLEGDNDQLRRDVEHLKIDHAPPSYKRSGW